MIVLTDCLTEIVDEGALKVANSLTKRIKQKYPTTSIITYGARKSDLSDVHINLNKLFLSSKLFKYIKKDKGDILYIPFASNTTASILRTLILSLFSSCTVKVLFVMNHPMSSLAKKILKISKASVYVLSKESYDYFASLNIKKLTYIQTGVDVHKFVPVSNEQKQKLREKYHINQNEKIILHVGHLRRGRNVDKLQFLTEAYSPYLVISSVSEPDLNLRKQLEDSHVKILDYYISNIEEIYQLSDAYFFPVVEKENCIDVPLSVLEAAACNLPIITTDYGELKSFKNEDGFIFIDSFNQNELTDTFDKILNKKDIQNDKAVQNYDWSLAVNQLVD